jgi:hypothetical protein
VRAPKKPRRLPKNLAERDVEALLDAPDVEKPLGLRDRAMLETLYATGVRVSELCGLTLGAVSLKDGVVRVLGKGSKERLVPLGDEAIGWIERYLAGARPSLVAGAKVDHVFVTARKAPMHAPGVLAPGQALRCGGGHRGEALSPHVLRPRLRDAPAQPRRRFARGPAAARPRRHHDDDDLHARRARAPEATALAAPSARLEFAVPMASLASRSGSACVPRPPARSRSAATCAARRHARRRPRLSRETPSCPRCGSTVRFRSIAQLVVRELLGRDDALPDLAPRRDLVGLGLSDAECYARPLARVFDYRNTFFHAEPRVDITATDRSLHGKHDFVIASDVFEHVARRCRARSTTRSRCSSPAERS